MNNHRRIDPEVLRDRAADLGTLNGIRLVFVDLAPAGAPNHAVLRLEFHNGQHLSEMFDAVDGGSMSVDEIFFITGGSRIVAGAGAGRVRVTDVAVGPGNSLLLTVEPIGDYSSYTLHVRFAGVDGHALIDPLLDHIDFKFRPGCFNLNCAPEWTEPEPPGDMPDIDYLARDYHSFKHNLINAMRERVPDWAPTSEADLDQVLIGLLAADADEQADFQDRVMNEAWLGRARKRVSLARHARLMDYHIHQGNQASTWLMVEVENELVLPDRFGVWTDEDWRKSGSVPFITTDEQPCHPLLNALQLYTWGRAVRALDVGATSADLALPAPLNPENQVDAETLAELFRRDHVRHLLLRQALNPETGTVNGVDTTARQLLRLLAGDASAEVVHDPLSDHWLVRVHWQSTDALSRRYCFVTDCPGQAPIETVSLFHGNLVEVRQGRPRQTVFRPPGSELALADPEAFLMQDEAHYEITRRGVVCELPDKNLAYRDTPPGGEVPPETSLTVKRDGLLHRGVEVGGGELWLERSDLIESDSQDSHYIVETDELGVSRLRFGYGDNGRPLPEGAEVVCRYQVDQGSEGNVGRDTITGFDASLVSGLVGLTNPFDVSNARDPEPKAEIIRRVPEAYRGRQRRAVSLEDYRNRAEALSEVAHARARYGWTGSWRSVRVAIDPVGDDELDDELREQVHRKLDALRVIGEDLEIRGARYVGLDIKLRLCAHADYWIDDLAAELEMRFSDGYLPDGKPAFFHPDRWTFGQPLHASQIVGAAMEVTGIERVLGVSLRRLHAGTGAEAEISLDPSEVEREHLEQLSVDEFEIIRVANDPNHLERGRMLFDIRGGRQ